MDTLSNWLGTMSSSAFRPFRNTGTTAALTLMTSLAGVSASTHSEYLTLSQQLVTETKKGESQRQTQLAERVAALNEKVTRLDDLISALYDVYDSFNVSIFAHRYRDIDAAIRQDCIRELGKWVQQNPNTFLDSKYLRYFGWMLSDKVFPL